MLSIVTLSSKVLSIVTFCSENTRALTFENSCQGPDENTFTIQMRKGAETFVCTHRAHLLSVLLPAIQGDVGGSIFSLRKWSKRMMAGLEEEGSRRPVRFRLWSGKLAVVQEDTSVCACEIYMHTIARILPLTDNRAGLVLQLKSSRGGGPGTGRILRFTVPEAENKGAATFSARDRLVRALADGALAHLGLTLPVEEMSDEQCWDLFNTSNAMSTDAIDAFVLHRVSAHILKPRLLHVAACGLIERDMEHQGLVHHSIPWAKLSHIVRVPGGESGRGGGGQDASATHTRGQSRIALCCTDGRIHLYESQERDVVVASLVDAATMLGVWLPVSADVMAEGWFVGGIGAEGDKEYEDALMERLSTAPLKDDEDIWPWVEMAHECNSNLSATAGTFL